MDGMLIRQMIERIEMSFHPMTQAELIQLLRAMNQRMNELEGEIASLARENKKENQ